MTKLLYKLLVSFNGAPDGSDNRYGDTPRPIGTGDVLWLLCMMLVGLIVVGLGLAGLIALFVELPWTIFVVASIGALFLILRRATKRYNEHIEEAKMKDRRPY